MTYPCNGSADALTSGTSRQYVPAGAPQGVPDDCAVIASGICHVGMVHSAEIPPPVPQGEEPPELSVQVPAHATSEVPLRSGRLVPPTPVTSGKLAGVSTDRAVLPPFGYDGVMSG